MSMDMDEKSEQTYTQSIILIGLMGSGKTTIGKEISRATGLPFLDMENRSILRRLGFTVWLNVDLPTLLQRTARSHGRPLLAENDREATLHRLIDERYPLYAETCHISIASSQLQPQQVADFIIARSAQFAKSLQ